MSTTDFKDFAQVVNCLMSTYDEIVIPKNNYNLNSSISIPRNKTLRFEAGTCLNISSGVVLTIQGEFKAPCSRIFYGEGIVSGIRQVYPEWWGAEGGSPYNQWAYFQAAHDCVKGSVGSKGGVPTIFGGSGLFMLGNTFTLQPTEDCPIQFRGAGHGSTGTRFAPLPSFPSAVVFYVSGSNNPTNQLVDLHLCDFSVVHNGAGNGSVVTGLRIGTPINGYKIDGWHRGKVKNIMINNFTIGLEIVHTRQIRFERVSCWNNLVTNGATACYIYQAGGFSGDLTFVDCQFVANTAAGCADVRIVSNNTISNGSNGNMIAGIKFITCDFYQASQKLIIYANAGSWIRDIWLNSCQFDGDSAQDIYIQANGIQSLIDNLNFNDCYCAGGNISSQPQVSISNTGGAKVGSVKFKGGSYQLAQGKTFSVAGVAGLSIAEVSVSDNNNQQGAAIQLTNCLRPVVKGNSLHRVTENYCSYFIQVDSDNSFPSVEGNIGAGIVSIKCVNDLTGNISKVVINNI